MKVLLAEPQRSASRIAFGLNFKFIAGMLRLTTTTLFASRIDLGSDTYITVTPL